MQPLREVRIRRAGYVLCTCSLGYLQPWTRAFGVPSLSHEVVTIGIICQQRLSKQSPERPTQAMTYSPNVSSYAFVSLVLGRLATSVAFVFWALLFFFVESDAFSSFIFSLERVVRVLAIFFTWSLGRSLASCLQNSCRKRA